MFEYNESFSKYLEAYSDLLKSDSSIEKLIGLSNPKQDKEYPDYVYIDTLCPMAGNRFAFNNFLQQNSHSGVFIYIDALDIAALNIQYGIEIGDKAIQKMFQLLYDNNPDLNLFRVKGDLALVYVNTPEEAKKYIETLTKKLEQTPNLIGEFKLSFAIGIGYGKEKGFEALKFAKRQLNKSQDGIEIKVNPPGKNPTVVYSLLNESPPEGWFVAPKIYVGEYYTPHDGMFDNGLKLHNPLRTTV